MRFTDSPFEKLMQEPPYVSHKHRAAPPPKCADCPLWWEDEVCRTCTRENEKRETSGQVVPKSL